ncbi:MAG: Lrp/AsnC family transcriptional regulator [Promethearchaeota archaeon]
MVQFKKVKLDAIDRQIISLIQKNPNMTHSEIAEKVNRSQPTIGGRLKKLLDSGILKIQAGVNFQTADIFLAFVYLKTDSPDEIMNMASHCPFMMNAYKSSGEFNIILLLASPKLEKLDGLVNSHFRNKSEIYSVKMEIILDIAKEFILPINLELQEELDPGSGECAYCKKFIV